MANTRAMATTVFCPPESCDIVRNDVLWPVKETSIRTPLVWSIPMPSVSSSASSSGRSMRSFPIPPRTSSAKISRKCASTCVRVWSSVSSFCSSTRLMKASMDVLDVSIFARFSSSSCSCVLKVVNWSMAFLFTCSNCCSDLLVLPSSFMICAADIFLYFPMSDVTTVRLLSFSSASLFFFTTVLIFMVTSSTWFLNCETWAWTAWSLVCRVSHSAAFSLWAPSTRASWSAEAFRPLLSSSCSRSRRPTIVARSCTCSSWSACESCSSSASSSRSRRRRKSCTCCSRALRLRSSLWQRSDASSSSASKAFSSSASCCSLACSAALRSPRLFVFTSPSIASIAATSSATWLSSSLLRSRCLRLAASCRAIWASASCTASATCASSPRFCPRVSWSSRRSPCRASSWPAASWAFASTSASCGCS
mmetsp:Transcript_34106/g.101345  ORF Transcript_34106/g.101345 Transcript_34106/m.101345 type:complete len:422 (+) Transcript_34106:323-1588(+)